MSRECPADPARLSPQLRSSVIPAVVLAAGMSTRMGRPKALLPLTGRRHVRRRASSARFSRPASTMSWWCSGTRRTPSRRASAATAASRRASSSTRRTRPGSSRRCCAGLNAIDRPGVTAMLLTLVDVPLVSPATVRAVVDRYRRRSAPIVRPVRGDEHGHPVLIDRSLFAAAAGRGSGARRQADRPRARVAAGDVRSTTRRVPRHRHARRIPRVLENLARFLERSRGAGRRLRTVRFLA